MPASKAFLPFGLLAIVVAVWFWPATILGQRLAGGSMTAAGLPVMSYYQKALQQNRLPLWNEQADFGRPILAEGQIGVLYPFNILLYRLLDAPDAYTAGMVIHFVMASWFAYLCARGFELNQSASLVAALVFVGQGFFVGHFAQPWSYTAGCWLPLAVLAAWRWLEAQEWPWLFGLALVLAIQLLAGHFQIAFYTHVVVVALAGIALLTASGRRRVVFGRGLLLLLALIVAVTAAAAQLIPTAELLVRADPRGRAFDYLSSFAIPPWQLVNYLAPTLFQQHPLWQPAVWTPNQTSAAECLTYVGLIPFGLAIWAAGSLRKERDTRICLIFVFGSIALSLGPILPGFSWLVELPGFGWFFAPARWSIVSGLFLGLLAGKGLERIEPEAFPRWSRRYLAGIAVVFVLCGAGLAAARQTLPFQHRPEGLLELTLLERGYSQTELSLGHVTPAAELPQMVFGEIWPSVLNVLLLLVASMTAFPGATRTRLSIVIIAWTIVDLGTTGHVLRRAGFEPRRTPTEQSRVLAELAKKVMKERMRDGETEIRAPGLVSSPSHLHSVSPSLWREYAPYRVGGTIGTFPMLAGISSFSQPAVPEMHEYWKLGGRSLGESLPSVPEVTRWGDVALQIGYLVDAIRDDEVEFLRMSNIRLLALAPHLSRFEPVKSLKHVRNVHDEWLTVQLFGPGSLRYEPDAGQWSIWELSPGISSARAWYFPLSDPLKPGTDPRLFLHPPPARRRMLDRAVPLSDVVDRGESVEIRGSADSPGVLFLSDLHYPGWNAVLTQSGSSQSVPIEPAFGDWRAVFIPQPGEFLVAFRYEPESFRIGWQISFVVGLLWMIGFAATVTRRY